MLKYMDQYDYKIILKLLHDGRTTFSNIAKDLDITDVAVKKRFERLVNKGIIKRVAIDIDYVQIGFGAEVIVFMKIEPLIEDKAISILKEDDFVKTIYKTTGDYNLVFIYLIKEIASLPNIEKLVSKIKGNAEFKFLFINDKIYEKQNIPMSSLQVYYS